MRATPHTRLSGARPLGRLSRPVLPILATLVPLAGCGSDGAISTELADATGPRNLVVVVLDTVRADHLGVYGYDRPTTPHLDRFAESALVFDQAQSASPWTAPALISLVTSLYPAVHGVRGFPEPARVPDGAQTLGEILRAAGVETAAFTEGGYARGDFGLDRGIDVFPRAPGHEDGKSLERDAPNRLEANLDRALDWLADRGERPFFLLFHTYEAHEPYDAPDEEIRRFRPGADMAAEHEALRHAIERWNAAGEWTRDDAVLYSRHEWHCSLAGLPSVERGEEQWERRNTFAPLDAAERADYAAWLIDLYDAELRTLDASLARLWAALDTAEHRRDTIVVVVSDHGEGFGEHGRFAHGTVLHEELLRIALLVRAPGLAPRRLAPVVRSVDVAPTVLDLLGRELPTPRQGVSLAPWLRGDAPPPALASYSHALAVPGAEDRLESVRLGRWRLVAETESEELALYDLLEDPEELQDVAAEHPEIAWDLFERLTRQRARDAALREDVGAPIPRPRSPEARRELETLGYIDER